MFFNKNWILKSVSKNSDSFDERFCDDLSEVILQYLPLKDKLRLEGVSKQFQRTVFQRHYDLFINTNGPKDHKYYLVRKNSLKINHNYYFIEDQSFNSFKALLKKCPNITSIDLDGHSFSDDNPVKINQVFRVIIENCNNLKEINVKNDINDNTFEEFQKKFGPKMKSLPFDRKRIDLNLFPNIEKIKILGDTNESLVSQLNLRKLKQLNIWIDQEHMLEKVIDNFPNLKHLILLVGRSYNENYNSLKNISKLKHLIHFKFNHLFFRNITHFSDLLNQMANNCQNLKRIAIRFIISDNNSDMSELLSQLKSFPALKRMCLCLNCHQMEIRDNIDVDQWFSFELFKGFSNITHLTIILETVNCHRKQSLKDSTLKDLDINLPKLQNLKVTTKFDTTPEGVTQMADILSRLSRLQTLILKFRKGIDFKPIEEQIIKKCRKIRKIKIKSNNNYV